jgi:hypothetical protein
MQLHMDRLFVQNQMERERHQQQAAELASAHEQQRAKDRQEHQGNLRAMQFWKVCQQWILWRKYTRALNFEIFCQAMQLAALQQREQQADEVWGQIAGVSTQPC